MLLSIRLIFFASFAITLHAASVVKYEESVNYLATSSLKRFLILDEGCICTQAYKKGMYYAGDLPHTPSSTNNTNVEELPADYIDLNTKNLQHQIDFIATSAIGIDRIRQKLYTGISYTAPDADGISRLGDGIFSMNFDGTKQTHILDRRRSGTDGSIAIAEQKQKIYYTQGQIWGPAETDRRTGLNRANLDGSGDEIIVDFNSMECRLANSTDPRCPPTTRSFLHATLDEEEDHIYWTLSDRPGIWRAGTEIPAGETWANRSDIEALLPWAVPAQMRFVGGFLYWIDSSQNATGDTKYPATSPVYRVDLSKSGDKEPKVELLLNVPLPSLSQAAGIAIDALTGETWVLVKQNHKVLYMWRFDGNGEGTFWSVGGYVFEPFGFEVL